MKAKITFLGAVFLLWPQLFASEVPNTLSSTEVAEGWHLLFDGKSLAGWRANESPKTFTVADGTIVVKGPRSHLFYTGPQASHDFVDFELSLDVLTQSAANSGVYCHTEWQSDGWPAKGYEIQVNNSHHDPKRTAGLYSIQDNFDSVAQDGVWFSMRIRVVGHCITTSVDAKVVSDFTEPDEWTPPAKFPSRRLGHGIFALQGHDPDSVVCYRNIKVRYNSLQAIFAPTR